MVTNMASAGTIKVLYLTPIPPPYGGIASLTGALMNFRFSDRFQVEYVNLNVIGRALHGKRDIGFYELFRNLKILFRLFSKVLFFRPHIVHLNSSVSELGIFRDYCCMLVARLARAKTVVHYHGDLRSVRCATGMLEKIFKKIAKQSNINIASNKPSLLEIEKVRHSPDDTILSNFVEPSQFNPDIVPRNEMWPQQCLRALYVGGLTRTKGVLDIIKVAEYLPQLTFTLVSGTVSDEFKPLARALPPNVFMKVGLSHQDLLQEYRNHDFFLFMSHAEGFPISVTEAMMMGLPIISTNVGSIPEMVEDGKGGFLVDSGNVQAAVTAIKRLAVQGKQIAEMGKYNRTKALNCYTPKTVIEHLCSLYVRLCGQGHGSQQS